MKHLVSSSVGWSDIVGVGDARVLVHGPARPARAVHRLAVRRAAERVLADRLLQPAGLRDGDAPGDHPGAPRLGPRRRRARQRRDQADERGHHFAAQRR